MGLIENATFRVFVDREVYTLIDYPQESPNEHFKSILNNDSYQLVKESDTRFTKSICIQFEEIV